MISANINYIMLVTQVIPEDFPGQDNLFQTAYWGQFKSSLGQQPFYFLCEQTDDDTGGTVRFPLLVLLRSGTSGDLYAYAPKAPSLAVREESYGIMLEDIAEAVRPFLPSATVCLRFDIPWPTPFRDAEMPRTEIRQMRLNFGTRHRNLRKSPLNHFCPDTVILDVSATPEQILARMRQTTRNSIRRAYRMGVSFGEKDASFLPSWHELYLDTGRRKGFFTEEIDYFEQLLGLRAASRPAEKSSAVQSAPPASRKTGESRLMAANPLSMPVSAPVPEPQFRLLAAEKDGVLLAGMILALCGKNAYYLYAGSRADYTEYMASYGLQWEAVLASRAAGCECYDLLGIPPNNNKSDPMSGLFTFKTGLGGTPVRSCGCWDYPFDDERYHFLCAAENMQ